jgi:hypothetical protein
MNTAGKLTAYGVALVLVAAGAWATGSAVGPLAVEAETHGAEGAGHGDDHSGTVAGAEQLDQPGGLASSRGGYTLTPTSTTLTAGANQPFSFRITGPNSRPVTAVDVEHDKPLHLIVVRRLLRATQREQPGGPLAARRAHQRHPGVGRRGR